MTTKQMTDLQCLETVARELADALRKTLSGIGGECNSLRDAQEVLSMYDTLFPHLNQGAVSAANITAFYNTIQAICREYAEGNGVRP